MKRLLSVLISFSMIFSSVSAVSALELQLPKSLESFTADVSALINEYEESTVSEEAVFFTADDESDTDVTQDTNRLIVKSTDSIDTLNSIGYVGGYNDLHILQFADDEDCDEALEYYSSLDSVEYVQEDGIFTESTVEEAEAVFEEAAIGTPSQYQSDFFGYSSAKDNMGSSEVIVAVIDSGVANDHEFLAGRVIPTGFDSINNESCYDDRGHGTHVAGIIVGNTKSNVKIKPYKVLDSSGQGTDTQVYLGIQAAVEDGVDIINLSLTRLGESEVIHEAVINAYNAGITVVAAAGNSNANVSEKFYSPASFDEVICAVSVSTSRYKADTSNWGSPKDLSAPGENILSTYLNNTYKILSGTSMAAPFISCCVAYLLSTGTYYSPDGAYSALYSKTRAGGGTHNIHYVCPGTLVNSKVTCETPQFTYTSGDFAGYLDVKITCATSGATIMYRTSDMSSNTYYEYTAPIRVTESTTVTAYAFCKNYKNSSSATVSYTKNDIDASMFEVDENYVLVGYTGTDTDVTVPGYFNGGCVTKVSSSAFSGNTDLTSVTFSKYVTTIGEGAFKGCTKLVSVSAPSVTEVEAEAFRGCSSLSSVSLPLVVNLGDKAFLGCYSLNSVSLTKLITIGNRAFENSGITTIYTSKVTTIGDNAFYATSISSAPFSYATTIGSNAFAYCENLTSVTLTNVESIGDYAFVGCESLKTVSLPKATTISNSAFKNCTSLTTVAAAVTTTIGDYAFYGCSELKTLTLSALTTVGDYSFAHTALESISLAKVTKMGTKAFGDCNLLKSISLAVITDFDCSSFDGSVNIETITLPMAKSFDFNGGTLATCFPNLTTFSNSSGFTSVPTGLFDGCSKLSSVTLNSSILNIGANAFRGTALTEVVFNSATSLGENCFANIPTLETVKLGALASVDFSVFSGSVNIKHLYLGSLNSYPDGFRCYDIIPNIVTVYTPQVNEVPDYAFKGCSDLTTFDFYYTEYIGVESFCGTAINNPYCINAYEVGERAFADCTNLGDVDLQSLYDIDLGIFENSEATITDLNLYCLKDITEDDAESFNFAKFINLRSIGLYNQPVIPEGAFKGCTALEEAVLTECVKVCKDAFADCTSLLYIELPNVTVIEDGAFSNCKNLESFTADAVTSFDLNTFNGCTKLKTLSFNSITEFPVDENGSFQITGIDNLTKFTADSLTVIPHNFMKDLENLSVVSFARATEVGDYAFYNTALSTYTLPMVTTVGDYAFYGTDITEVSSAYITSVGEYSFAECKSLKKFSLPVEELSVNAISGCDAITILALIVSELPVDSDGSSYVSDKPLLQSFTANYAREIPDYYFVNNTELVEVSITQARTIGERAFMNVPLTEAFECDLVDTIGEYAFSGSGIESFTCDSLIEVEDYAFYGSDIGRFNAEALSVIGDYAFADCESLSTFYARGEELILGTSAFENDIALKTFSAYGEFAIPDKCFKNCELLKSFYSSTSPKRDRIAYITSLGNEAFSGCTALSSSYIDFTRVEYMGTDCLNGISYPLSMYVQRVMPNLITVEDGGFNGFQCVSLALENIEVLRDIPDCDFVVIGSDIKEFGCAATDTVVYAYEDSVVEEFCTTNGINFKKYNTTDSVVTDVSTVVGGYEDELYFEAAGFNLTYTWYACNNPDRSDAEVIATTLDDPQTINPIEPFFDNYEENKYKYFYCVATSTENGNVLDIQSGLSKNIFATIRGTENTFIDFWGESIYTHSIDNINTLDNIITVDGDIEVTPSYSTADLDCYGTGSTVKIMNNGEFALGQYIIVYGDINGDAVIDVLDVTTIEKAMNENATLDGDYKLAADIDSSGAIDAADYQSAVNKALS